MSLNLVVVAMFAVNVWLRTMSAPGATLPIALSVVAVVLLGISGWLGGEMVYIHGVSVESHYDPTGQGREKGRLV